MPDLIDSHVHLYNDQYDADRDAVVERAHEAGVTTMLLPAVDVASIEAALALADRYPGLYAMAGIHPSYVHESGPDDLGRVAEALTDPRVVAVGETGLDYYWSRDHVEAQQHSLREHARLAVVHGLPIVLHNRDQKGSDACTHDIVRILNEVRTSTPGGEHMKGVFHCFGGPEWLTEEVMDLGFHVGLGGTLTFKNAGVPEAIRDVPLDRIVLETDGPYLAPTPHRGTRNEPAHVALVAARLAEVLDLTIDEVVQATTRNARRLFGLDRATSADG